MREALKMGYRLIDTANAYVNERAVGRGMKESKVKREDIFLSTKLWPICNRHRAESHVDQERDVAVPQVMNSDALDTCFL